MPWAPPALLAGLPDHSRARPRTVLLLPHLGLCTYRGERLMRISVSDWATDTDDVDRVAEALLRHAEQGIV